MVDDATNTLALLQAAVPTTHRLITGITTQQWHGSTPCADMDVAALVAHLIDGLDQFAAVASAETGGAPVPAAVADPDVSNIDGAQAASLYAAASARLLDAWSAHGALDRLYAMPWGETPGLMLVGFMVIEQVTHGWDLARATGQEPAFDDDLAEATLALAQGYDDDAIRVPGMFGPAITVSPDATPIDRLAGFLGRQP
jgi:uncharacterized protein (TIGR03086 family)